MPAFSEQGLNAQLVHDRTLYPYVGVSDDPTAFDATQTRLDPTGTANNLILPATVENIDNVTDQYTINVTSANFGNKEIFTIGLQTGPAATDNASRSVRTLSIGVQPDGDDFTVGIKLTKSDQTT